MASGRSTVDVLKSRQIEHRGLYKIKVFSHEAAWDILKRRDIWLCVRKVGEDSPPPSKRTKHLHPTPTPPLQIHNSHSDSAKT